MMTSSFSHGIMTGMRYYTMTTDYKKREIFYLTLSGPGADKFSEITGKLSLSDTVMSFDKNFKIHLMDPSTGDTVDVSYPNKFTGIYSFYVLPGKYRLIYTGAGYFSQSLDTIIKRDNRKLELNIDIYFNKRPVIKKRYSGI